MILENEELEEEPEEELPLADSLDILDLWNSFTSPHYGSVHQSRFLDHLRTLVSDPDAIDEITFCEDCGNPERNDETSTVESDRSVCDYCVDSYHSCDRCEELYRDLRETLSGGDVCESCRANHYSYCEDCDGYYNDNDSSEHEHSSGDGCCESPQLEFAIRNDGMEPLKNDTKVTVTLPAGIISNEGMDAIRRYLRDLSGYTGSYYDLSYDLSSIGDEWQGKRGNFTKRLSAFAYKTYGLKISPDALSAIGTIASDHSKSVDVSIDITRDLNLPPGEFYHDDSCWWQSYSESRCTLKTNGGFGMRSYSDGDLTGRAWVLPLRKTAEGNLVPTFNTLTPDAMVVFNGYGALSGYPGARIIAHMTGHTYRKIGFECSPMYINSGGYLIAPEEIASKYTDGELMLSVSTHSNLFSEENEASLRKEYVNA